MPYRQTPLVTEEIYHVFNRSIAKQPIFPSSRDYQRMMETIEFYLFRNTPSSFSHFRRLPQEDRLRIIKDLRNLNKQQISILSFCLMPNHFHFQLKQIEENGIARFVGNLQNSYAKYFNTKTKRSGALFQSMFKAVRIESDEQLIHVARYIHLNPSTAYIIRDASKLENYPWNSFPHYLNNSPSSIVDKEIIMSYFKSTKDFKKFTLDQADYQRQLKEVEHLILE